MINTFSILLVYQLLGELLARALVLPVPDPVIGMALLFVTFLAWGSVSDELRTGSANLLQHLSLLFVPAGAGVSCMCIASPASGCRSPSRWSSARSPVSP